MRFALAAVLGLFSFFLMFLLGEGVRNLGTVPAADYITGFIFVVGMGGYSLLATYLLLRGVPKASRNGWIVLVLNAVLLLASVIALLVEPNKLVALQTLGIALLAIAGSYAGLRLAARKTDHP
jgi:hypothetical protein